uniref:Uncharacterized protein n=1 Tax=Acrobeloides nanus TaxID=290746 RepID=A0A914D7R7_9BILA
LPYIPCELITCWASEETVGLHEYKHSGTVRREELKAWSRLEGVNIALSSTHG